MIFIRFFGWLFGVGALVALVVAAGIGFYIHAMTDDLPDYAVLKEYEPPVMTRIHAADGQLVAEYARERRLFLPIQMIPDQLKAAFLSAEDRNFYSHPGFDVTGIARAVVDNVQNFATGQRMAGASTITQQVAKNFLLSNEYSVDRKIKEAILAVRIEQALSKDQILELYLNEIYLGFGAYGVAAASLTYFDKAVQELTLPEVAYLAALPKAPSNYHPYRDTDRALERRNWVIDRMVANGYVTPEEADAAKAEPLTVTPRPTGTHLFAADYFVEEVRRGLMSSYGDTGLYEGGLSVRTTLDPEVQMMARKSLMKGLVEFDRANGWRGPVESIDVSGDWGPALNEISPLSDVPEWELAVVLSAGEDSAEVGLRPGRMANGELSEDRVTGRIPRSEMEWARWASGERAGQAVSSTSVVLNEGDVIYVELVSDGGSSGSTYRLRQIPEIGGALVAMDPVTGRVHAMVGGFSFDESEFNRATQAMRQPGSSFKPFIYAAALDNGYTPSSVVLDAPLEISQGPGLEMWRPQNYGREFYGPTTLRTGIELSRNVMTVRLARDMGMPLVAEYARRFGIYDDMPAMLSMSLGAGETTVLRMTNAYSMIANGGRRVQPTLIDRIQNRHGETIYKHDERICEGCEAEEWRGQAEPTLIDEREQVLDPMTAYQTTSMLQGVVTRGTAAALARLERPLAGKTGTTNEEKDAWFVGYSPDMTVGVFIGYDQPRRMGRGMTGGRLAAPIFGDFMQTALAGRPAADFAVPEGLNLIPIDRRTGMRSASAGEGVILEAFKPGMGPSDHYEVIGSDFVGDVGGFGGESAPAAGDSDRAIISGTGGLY